MNRVVIPLNSPPITVPDNAEREFTRQVLTRVAVTKIRIERKFLGLIDDSIKILNAILEIQITVQT